MNRFRLKLTFTILSLISLVLIVIGIFIGKVMERSYLQMQYDLLRKEALFISETIIDPKILTQQERLEAQIQHFTESMEVRITVVDPLGVVMADTSGVDQKLKNHAHRPEIEAALRGQVGIAHRESDTLHQQMIYVAVPLKDNRTGQVVGAVRSAMSMQTITQSVHQMWFSLVMGLVITLIIGSIVSSRISHGITKPIEEIIRVARNITQRQYESRVKIKPRDELGQLATAINFMASSLEQQMYQISENQQRLTGVLATMPSGVILIAENGRIELINNAVEKMLNISSSELVGKLHFEAGHNYGFSKHIDDVMRTGERKRDEIHIFYPTERMIYADFSPYVNYRGEIKGVLAVLNDITDIRRLEKMRSDFVANVSHELRTPITSIKGFTETLLDGALKDEEISRHFLQIIYDESERLFRLISDILDLSKIEQKRITLTYTEVEMHRLIEETAVLLREQLQRKELKLILPADQGIMLRADKDCLQQILLNLLANAIAYTPEGGNITIELRRDEDYLYLDVADTGIGIPEDDLGRIFERFYRVDKARSRDSGGTGLGLAIVKHICESLHGSITVRSTEGVGSVFSVILPLDNPIS
ncbi:PAS domain-containing sensor histidine kinase [Brevibacillus sp. SKDU10]|uniref:two-component system histidine kinase PnpS n=1 Tax=Brevibacillus sp. SKDU10 TaxID=1247872 RepID=UPI0007C98695|nr:ATP-binding protein [Brevibacillus sp. SKDU10]OAJ74457.1 PAS domain-containing sensor histidine kinase [Brevibacillus sp. SKDU10]